MGPQFVDFNGDGHIDIFTATFDGSPWVSLGSKEGFQKPEHIKDKEGNRVILARYWDYEAKKWTSADHTGGKAPSAHCISAVAFDWDNDGDFDIIMGDRKGGLFLNINEGTAKEPRFSTTSSPIMIGDKPLDAGGKITAPKLVDWDKDGLTDIVVGTFESRILLFRNVGEKGKPVFEAPKVLLDSSARSTDTPLPDNGAYVDVVDLNGDGEWDLVVGAYTYWSAPDAEKPKSTYAARKPYIWIYKQKKEDSKEEAKEAPKAEPEIER